MAISRERIESIVAEFGKRRIVVAGDFLADVYLHATPDRLSREAPVMVARWREEVSIPGGAANAASNLIALGAQVHPVGIVADDEPGRMLSHFFRAHCADCAGIVEQNELQTPTKVRVLVGEEGRSRQQVLRIDREPDERPSLDLRTVVRERLAEAAEKADAVILSDYGYGLVDNEEVAALGDERDRLILAVDSRAHLADFHAADLVTPNHQEASAFVGHRVFDDEEVGRAGAEIRARIGAKTVIVTRGNRGMMVDDGSGQVFIPASGRPGEVTDVSGAGDTVIAVATLALCCGATPREAAEIANHAAGVVVTRLGAATVGPDELVAAVVSH